MSETSYRGRFAPSPTGPLHFGSLVAAIGSYLDARHHRGVWLVRIEDIDPPREVRGAADEILRTLEQFEMHWDCPVSYQSRHDDRYAGALKQLHRSGHLYGCACTRKEVADSAVRNATGVVYPGTCRNGMPPGRKARSLRVRVDAGEIFMQDRLQGANRQLLQEEVGDFIVRRADNFTAYQLAVVIDDADQDITHVVRGVDLLGSTPRQIYLQRLLGLDTPEYLHLPVAVNTAGEKLSKQTHARSIMPVRAQAVLLDALCFLHQELPESPQDATLQELWTWAIAHWDVARIPASPALPAPKIYLE